MSASEKTPILIIDDHPMMRAGLGALIKSKKVWEVCGEVGTAREGLDAIERLRPALVLLDLALPDKNGMEVLKDIRASHPDVLVLIISSHDEGIYAERVLRAGARGYIMKDQASDVLIQAITQVLDGSIFVSSRMSAMLLERMSGQKKKGISAVEQLTDRELEVFTLIGQGISTHDIAARLCISHRTVDAHRAHIREKLGLGDGNALLRFAVRWIETENPD